VEHFLIGVFATLRAEAQRDLRARRPADRENAAQAAGSFLKLSEAGKPMSLRMSGRLNGEADRKIELSDVPVEFSVEFSEREESGASRRTAQPPAWRGISTVI